MAKELRKRSEVAKEYTWATEDLYASDELWYADFEKAKEFLTEAKEYKGKLGTSSDVLYRYLVRSDEQEVLLDSLSGYAARKKDEDMTNTTYQAMYSQLMSFYGKLSEAYSYVTPELVAIPEETYQRFLKKSRSLAFIKGKLSLCFAKRRIYFQRGRNRFLHL